MGNHESFLGNCCDSQNSSELFYGWQRDCTSLAESKGGGWRRSIRQLWVGWPQVLSCICLLWCYNALLVAVLDLGGCHHNLHMALMHAQDACATSLRNRKLSCACSVSGAHACGMCVRCDVCCLAQHLRCLLPHLCGEAGIGSRVCRQDRMNEIHACDNDHLCGSRCLPVGRSGESGTLL